MAPRRAEALPPLPAVLGERVRARRQERGWSLEGLAHRAELDWSYLGQIERGRRNLTLVSIVRIADALEVDPAELVGGMTLRRS